MMHRISLVVALILLAGCGAKKTATAPTAIGAVTTTEEASGKTTTTVKGEQGEIKAESNEEGGRAEIRDKEGKITQIETGKGVDLAKAGIPVYPGASVSDDGKAAATVAGAGAEITNAALTTGDPPNKVVTWYEHQLKSVHKMTTPDGGVLTGQNSAGDTLIVTVTKEESKTVIGVQVQKKL